MDRIGIVTARPCPRCGHHEVGYVTRDGAFHPLKPGTTIEVLDGVQPSDLEHTHPQAVLQPHEAFPPGFDPPPSLSGEAFEGHEAVQPPQVSERTPWIPEAIRGDRRLRKKYAVPVASTGKGRDMTPQAYRLAYLEKLKDLIERENSTPLAVILDRYFTAPHLGAGTPEEVAKSLWEDLDEIRDPVTRLSAWLTNRDDRSLARMIHPLSREDMGRERVSDEALARELGDLSLEEFFDLLIA